MNPDAFLIWLGDTPIATLVRDAWYPYVRAIHVGGAGILFGALVLFDLRVLGRKRGVEVRTVHDLTIGFVWLGFFVALAGGILLFSAQPQALWENTALRVKVVLIVVAGLNALVFEFLFQRNRSVANQRLSAALSLGLWATALTFSSLIPYWGL